MRIFLSVILACTLAQAEEQVQFQPGVLAKIYACGAYTGTMDWQNMSVDTSNAWPIKALPDAPGEVQRLREFPTIEATPLTEMAKGVPASKLVKPKTNILTGINYYAVEFEGYLLADMEGVYTLVVTSDDPVQIFIEGKSILNDFFEANPILLGVKYNGGPNEVPDAEVNNPLIIPSVNTSQASFKLSPNKYYQMTVICRQRWLAASGDKSFVKNGYANAFFMCNLNRGAVLRVTLTTPDGKSAPLSLQLPVVAK